MRPFDQTLIQDLREELQFIWAAHSLHYLQGEMRLFSPPSRDIWQSHEPGFEIWFSPETLDNAIAKLSIFYRNGDTPNSPFFLDPMVYKRDASLPAPVAQGSGIVWTSAYATNLGEEVSEQALIRLRKLGIFSNFIEGFNADGTVNPRAGIKAIAFSKDIVKPIAEYSNKGNPSKAVLALNELIDLNSKMPIGHLYPLGGITYRMKDLNFQEQDFRKIFPKNHVPDAKGIQMLQIFPQKIVDAAICWNAYGRDHVVYERYGIDVANLESNLRAKEASDAKVRAVRYELELLWNAHKRHGLKGEMRLYTAPTQSNFRSKQEGIEIWFDDTTESMIDAAKRIQFYYNGGILPNSPVLLDPVVYSRNDDGTRTPLGSGVAWATCFNTGLEKYNDDTLMRIKDLKAYTGFFVRAGQFRSGLKIVSFLDKPYLFTAEEKASAKPGDALSFATCQQLFDIASTNGMQYAPYYLLTGIEYLCGNGAFSNDHMEEELPQEEAMQSSLVARYSAAPTLVADAAQCWKAYDQLHELWKRFGIDAEHLDENLRYYNLCGRNFELLNMMGESVDAEAERFEFLVPGWIPKSSITLIAGTGGTGKSSLAHRLAFLTASDWSGGEAPKWLGSSLNPNDCKNVSIYFSGEDSPGIVKAREEMFDASKEAKRLLLKCGNEFGLMANGNPRSFTDFMKTMWQLPKVDVLVIDPARKYIVGDEDNAEAVSQFFDILEAFATEKECAVVVVHTLERHAQPESTRDVLDMLRGCQVFADRARVVIGMMLTETGQVAAGLAKNSIPTQLGMVDGEQFFNRDAETLDLVAAPKETGTIKEAVTAKEVVSTKESGIEISMPIKVVAKGKEEAVRPILPENRPSPYDA